MDGKRLIVIPTDAVFVLSAIDVAVMVALCTLDPPEVAV
jgi:hypothetical protein